MKHAVMTMVAPDVSRGDFNIGDYVQGLAADQFMHADTYVNREALDEYAGEAAKVILNGWFMHHPEKFPPSPALQPLFVSFHLNPEIAETFLSPKVVAYLKAHGPIGCRDRSTVDILAAKGIAASFTGCLTLTLGRTYRCADDGQRTGVCFIDPFQPFKKADFKSGRIWMLRHPRLTLRIYRRMKVQMLVGRSLAHRLRWFFRIGAFIRAYLSLFPRDVLERADYFTHMVPAALFKSEDEKFAYARRLLERYAKAKFCATSRIHCALPCTGMGTPVLFINPSWRDIGSGRFDGLLEFFNPVVAHHDRLEALFKVDSPDGRIHEDTPLGRSDAFRTYADALAAACQSFAAR